MAIVIDEYIYDTPGYHILTVPQGNLVKFEIELTGAGGGGGNRTSIGTAAGGGGGSYVYGVTEDPAECATIVSFLDFGIDIPNAGANGVTPPATSLEFGSGVVWPQRAFASSGRSVSANSAIGGLGGPAVDCLVTFSNNIINLGGTGANAGSTYGGGGGEAGGKSAYGANGNTYVGGNGISEGGTGGNGATSHAAGGNGYPPGGGGGGARMTTTGARELKGGSGGDGRVVVRFHFQIEDPPADSNIVMNIIDEFI